MDPGNEADPAEDQPRVKLDQARAGLDLGEGGCPRIDAADADQRERAFRTHIGFGEHPGGERKERPAREAALLYRGHAIAQIGTCKRRVADDHSVDAMPACDADNVI